MRIFAGLLTLIALAVAACKVFGLSVDYCFLVWGYGAVVAFAAGAAVAIVFIDFLESRGGG